MTPRIFAILNLILLAATAPWPFVLGSEVTVGGFPAWAAFTIGASAAYAVFVAICLSYYWERWTK